MVSIVPGKPPRHSQKMVISDIDCQVACWDVVQVMQRTDIVALLAAATIPQAR
jgi:hypothetical protein